MTYKPPARALPSFRAKRQPKPTSVEAFMKISMSGVRSERRVTAFRKVCEIFLDSGRPPTAGEVDHALGNRGEYHKRFSELEEMGVIEVAGHRADDFTGHECETWAPTGAYPRSLKKKKTEREELKDRIRELEHRVEELEEENRRLRDESSTNHLGGRDNRGGQVNTRKNVGIRPRVRGSIRARRE